MNFWMLCFETAEHEVRTPSVLMFLRSPPAHIGRELQRPYWEPAKEGISRSLDHHRAISTCGGALLTMRTAARMITVVLALALLASVQALVDIRTVDSFLAAAKLSNRGQSKNSAKSQALSILSEIETAVSGDQDCSLEGMAGAWELCFTTDDVSRSSPFFWAFRKALDGRKSNRGLSMRRTNDLAEAILTVTDTIPYPLKEIGPAKQIIDFPFPMDSPADMGSGKGEGEGEGDGAEGVEGEEAPANPAHVPVAGSLVSEVVVKALLSAASVMRTSSLIFKRPLSPNQFDITVQTTEVLTKNPAVRLARLAATPLQMGLRRVGRQRVADAISAFPSGGALERVKPLSSTVTMRVTYLDESLRVVRPDNDMEVEKELVYVYRRI
jgi:hypothetical protein